MADVTDAVDQAGSGSGTGSESADGARIGTRIGPRIDADRLAELEQERRFLLRSLVDLERERDAGDIDEADYEALRDGYTTRAAAVLRSIAAGRAALANRPPRQLRRTFAIAVAVVLVGTGLGLLVARFASPRGSGDTITGGTDSDRVSALLSEGRSAMGTSDYSAATESYREVLDIEPDNVEARAYLGWVLANASQQLAGDDRATTLAAGKQGLIEATEIDPTYADAYCFLAIIAAQFDNDTTTATTREDECLGRDPSAEMQELISLFVKPVTAQPTTDPASTADS